MNLPKSGDGLCLDRIVRFYDANGIDVERLARCSVVITGSNGKGSTARFAAAALASGGRRVGCFTSPHLFNIRERFAIDDRMIPPEAFDRYRTRVLAFNDALPEGNHIGAFEALFLIAILWFEDERPDAIVWEAGLGGRYDPVRTLRAKVSVLTSVELEHTEVLGATEELIAFDKIDALAPGGTLVVSPSTPANLRRRIESFARLTARTPVFAADVLSASDVSVAEDGTRFHLAGPGIDTHVHLALLGEHQVQNAIAALAAARIWAADGAGVPAMIAALERTRWPGRLEQISTAPDAWIDVGHTPGSIACITAAWNAFRSPENTLAVFGVSYSKEVQKMAAMAAAQFPRTILTRAHKAGTEPAQFAGAFAGRDVEIIPDITTAAAAARDRASREGLSILVLGGLFLAIEFQHAWTGGDPRELDFF